MKNCALIYDYGSKLPMIIIVYDTISFEPDKIEYTIDGKSASINIDYAYGIMLEHANEKEETEMWNAIKEFKDKFDHYKIES